MTISIWRYSHLALAVSSFVFIILASVTGIILAFQPISEQLEPYHVADLDTVTMSQTLQVFKQTYPEILEIKVDANKFVSASVFTEEGDNLEGYFNPLTAAYLGETLKPSPFFQWITSFHRSLFLKGVGRFFVGLCSFLLFLIAVSGTVLVIKRQRGLKHFFSRVVNENFSQYWHVVLGRLSLIPIIIITLTGVYLSLEKFNLITIETPVHNIDFETLTDSPARSVDAFEIFQNTKLSQLKSLEFPFSEDVEDYFTLKLKNSEHTINQYTGDVLTEVKSPFVAVLSRLSMSLHTGQGSILWALILAIASANILFFVYSGFAMTFKRRKTQLKNTVKKAEAEYVLLVGSENGSTLSFANQFQKALLKAGKKAYITELNNYMEFPNMSQMLVFSATYGQGEAPTNSNKFLELLSQIQQQQNFGFSVVGFGSYAYPDFCQFAIAIDKALEQITQATRLTKLHTINDKSLEAFQQFVRAWSDSTQVDLQVDTTALETQPKHLKTFQVVNKTEVFQQPDNTFLLTLKPEKKANLTSGDLLAIYPENNHRERLYSIGKVNGAIQLSVKHYSNGLGSNFLNGFSNNENLQARLIKNEGFHFPKKASKVIMIANGTGIAPFLGMLDENPHVPTHLYFGLRTQASFQLYQEQIAHLKQAGKLSKFNLALSREAQNCYVQDLLRKDSKLLVETLQNKGCIMICGALAMQDSVFQVLEKILLEHHLKPLAFYRKNKQLKTDCY